MVELRSVKATSPEEVEVVYIDHIYNEIRGVRISADEVRSAPQRISDSTIEEVAFDIVTTGICEPRPAEDFDAPDVNGVRWLSVPRWLEDVT